MTARPVQAFLDSLGVCTHIGQGVDHADQAATALRHAGVRNIRDDGSARHVPDWLAVHQAAGVRVVLTWSGPDDAAIGRLLDWSRQLAAAGALLALEGPNEPNNWAVTYQGQKTGATTTFLPLARWMAEFYRQAKADPVLRAYPVFHSSEAGGSEPDNVGLQFLTIPAGAGTLMPDGTAYADYANVHNYVCRQPAIIDNMTWVNADPVFQGWTDGIHAEYGKTWRKGFTGYSATELATLPRVTTETGWVTGPKGLTQEQQGRLYLNLYLAQFRQGFRHTFLYMLRDGGGDDAGYGIVDSAYRPKLAATYLHNLTTILADEGQIPQPGDLPYRLANAPATVHDLLLQKHDGTFLLAVWNERAHGSDRVSVELGGRHDRVTVYDPTVGTAPVAHHEQAAAVTLELSDHPLLLEIPRPPATTPLAHGQRVFSTGHSFHTGFAPILDRMARAAGYTDSAIAGVSNIGGSKVSQHADLPAVTSALAAGTVDVLMTTPIYLPDPGVEQLARLGAAHNPDFRLTLMEFWLPFDNYEPRNYTHGPAGSPTAHIDPPPVDHNTATVAGLRASHQPYVAEMDALVAAVNQQLGREVVCVVPVGQAVIALRERIIAGQAPGLTSQWDLFADQLGHPKPVLTILMGYCHHAVVYRRSPVGLPVPAELGHGPDAPALNRLLQELAWSAVTQHPLSGVRIAPQ